MFTVCDALWRVGPIMSEVTTDLPHVQHKLRLYSSPGLDAHAIEIMNVVDIRQESNKELTMRLVTDVQNEDHQFFTDLNGYQVSSISFSPI